jgi:SAM-dependent methyltransferase
MPTERRLASRLQRGSATRRVIYAGGRRRALELASHLVPMLEGRRTLLDIGSGTCNLAEVLCESGLRVAPLDLADYSFVDGLRPIIYDGERMPFDDDRFEVALLGSVLHHVERPEHLLREAGRVAPRVLVVEDVHRARLHRMVCSVIDSLLSLELDFPSHGYRSEAGWRRLFERQAMEVAEVHRWRSMGGLFHHVAFLLERSRQWANR